jgi:hypothetical protein
MDRSTSFAFLFGIIVVPFTPRSCPAPFADVLDALKSLESGMTAVRKELDAERAHPTTIADDGTIRASSATPSTTSPVTQRQANFAALLEQAASPGAAATLHGIDINNAQNDVDGASDVPSGSTTLARVGESTPGASMNAQHATTDASTPPGSNASKAGAGAEEGRTTKRTTPPLAQSSFAAVLQSFLKHAETLQSELKRTAEASQTAVAHVVTWLGEDPALEALPVFQSVREFSGMFDQAFAKVARLMPPEETAAAIAEGLAGNKEQEKEVVAVGNGT